MTHASNAGFWTLIPALLLLVIPQGMAGQEASTWTGADYPELDRMHDDAIASIVTSTPALAPKLQAAAERHREVADLRPEDDVRRFDCLRLQGQLLHHAGDLTAARSYMKKAAEHAEVSGHVVDAAMAYIDAALLAQKSGNGTAAAYLASRAERLTVFSFLESSDLERILKRLGSIDA